MPVLQDRGNGHVQAGSIHLDIIQNASVFLQLIAVGQLGHLFVIRRSPSLVLALGTLIVVILYIADPSLAQDVHFLTVASRTPHPIADPAEPGTLHNYWYNAALISIFASAFLQLQALSRSRNGPGRTPEWAIVFIGLGGAIALAGMRSPVLEAFLGSDFDKTRRLSGANVLIAFLLLLWRGVTFLDILSTVYSLSESSERGKIVLALWQRASLPMAAELIFDICSILLYESVTLKTFSRDELGHQTAGIQVFDSPMAIALTTLTVALAKSFAEHNARSSTPSNDDASLTKN